MDTEQPISVIEAKPVPKRSPRERLVVWSGIAILLVIVVIEWTSLRQFKSSLSSLEVAIAAPSPSGNHLGIPRGEVEKHIDGITFRDQRTRHFKPLTDLEDEAVEIQHELMYRWPSLFKKYQLIVTVNSRDRAILVATDIPTESRGP